MGLIKKAKNVYQESHKKSALSGEKILKPLGNWNNVGKTFNGYCDRNFKKDALNTLVKGIFPISKVITGLKNWKRDIDKAKLTSLSSEVQKLISKYTEFLKLIQEYLKSKNEQIDLSEIKNFLCPPGYLSQNACLMIESIASWENKAENSTECLDDKVKNALCEHKQAVSIIIDGLGKLK